MTGTKVLLHLLWFFRSHMSFHALPVPFVKQNKMTQEMPRRAFWESRALQALPRHHKNDLGREGNSGLWDRGESLIITHWLLTYRVDICSFRARTYVNTSPLFYLTQYPSLRASGKKIPPPLRRPTHLLFS